MALLIIQSIVCLIVIAYLFLAPDMQKYGIFKGTWFPNSALIKKILFLGLPIGIQFGAELFAMMLSTYLMGYFGVVALASIQIVSQYVTLGIMIILGLSQGVALLVSEAYAKKDIDLIRQSIFSAMFILICFFTLIILIFFFAPEILIRLFANKQFNLDNHLISLTTQFFLISGIFLMVDGFRNLFSGTLRGLHDSKTPMKLGIFCLWFISLPVSYFVGFTLAGGPIGLRIGFLSGFIIATILLWFKIRNKIKFILEPVQQQEKILTAD